jgi:hypothetical protein
MTQKLLKVGILTISDRASAGVYEDLSGKAIKDYLQDNMASDWKSEYLLVPDSLSAIKKGIMQLGRQALLPVASNHGRHRSIFQGCYPGGHRGRMQQNAAWIWRTYACSQS